MEGPFNYSVLNRLPSAIQKLDFLHQKVYIYLRLRKEDEKISQLLGIPIEEVRPKARRVREELIRSGQLYLIEEPQFVSIHPDPNNPDAQEFQLTKEELSVDKKLIIKEFLSDLKETINELPQHQSHLLRLKFNHQMSTKEIYEFLKRYNLNIIPGKEIAELKEQDIFYALNVALKAVIKGLQKRYKEEPSLCPENLKIIFEEIEI